MNASVYFQPHIVKPTNPFRCGGVIYAAAGGELGRWDQRRTEYQVLKPDIQRFKSDFQTGSKVQKNRLEANPFNELIFIIHIFIMFDSRA